MIVYVVVWMFGLICGVFGGAWAIRSDIMLEHKTYFDKEKERREWRKR